MKKLITNYKKPGLLALVLAVLLVGVTQSQAARNLLGWPPQAAAQKEQGENRVKGREQRKIESPAPSGAAAPKASQAELLAARERAQLNRAPSSRVNMVDLLAESEIIVHGDIINVRDRMGPGLPHTQVDVRVRESIRGEAGEVFSFRQFGMINPRRINSKYKMLNLTPAGWATYKEGEEVVLFLHAAASLTGLRAPIGLEQGKFELSAGNAVNTARNIGLFDNMELPVNQLTAGENTMLLNQEGPVNTVAFLTLLRRAVNENWVERGMLRHVQK